MTATRRPAGVSLEQLPWRGQVVPVGEAGTAGASSCSPADVGDWACWVPVQTAPAWLQLPMSTGQPHSLSLQGDIINAQLQQELPRTLLPVWSVCSTVTV